jgi:ABC-type antimicrobial peptide transport system permease subunit
MFKNALQALKINALKTFLVYLSLTFSIVSIFLIHSIANGIIDMYSTMLKTDGDIIITQAKISDTFFSNVDIGLIEKIKKIEGVEDASAFVIGASPVESLPIVAIYGVTKNRFKNYELVSGSYPLKNEAIVGESILYNLEDKKNITVANKAFKISGVFKSEIGFENGGVVINTDEAGEIFNKSASIVMVNAIVGKEIEPLLAKIAKLDKNIAVKSTDNFITNYNQFKIIKTSSTVISFIAFIMGLIGIVSIMSITIHQRRSEFGIKRAIGVKMSNIIGGIVSEAVVLGVLSFFSAYLISTLLLYFIKNSAHLQGYVNGEISLTLAFGVFIASLVMVAIGSILPAINAAKTDPIVLIQGNRS